MFISSYPLIYQQTKCLAPRRPKRKSIIEASWSDQRMDGHTLLCSCFGAPENMFEAAWPMVSITRSMNYRNRRNGRCEGTFSSQGTESGATEANSKFWLRSRDMCTFWSFGGVKSGQISAASMKIKILLGSPTQYPFLGPHAKSHASSFSNFFWRVPGFERAFASSIPSVFVE